MKLIKKQLSPRPEWAQNLFEPSDIPGRSQTGAYLNFPKDPPLVNPTTLSVTGSTDIPMEDANPTTVVYPFGTVSNDRVELHIYNMIDSLMESSYTVPYSRGAGLAALSVKTQAHPNVALNEIFGTVGGSSDPGVHSINLDLHNIFRNLGYISGKFKFQLNFHRNVLGSYKNPANILGISSDRTELSILYSGSADYLLSTPLVDYYGNRTEFYANVGNNELFRIATFALDPETSGTNGNVYTVVLQNPLPGDIGPSIPIWIDVQAADPQNDTIVIYPKKKKENYNLLKGPNFNIETNDGFAQSTTFKNWDMILGSNPTSSQQLIVNLLSSSFNPIDLAIDYRDYSQFVFYSSAEERLKNFRYKLQLLEYYDSMIATNNSISNPSIAVNNNLNDLNSKRNALLSGFDGYEKYLYSESSSYETSSYGEFTPSTWPKTNSQRPYTLYSVTSSQGNSWFLGQLDSASYYDNQNKNALRYLIPEHILESRNNESYVTFINMIAQHFDLMWAYVHHLTRIHTREDSLTKGLAKDLIYHVLRSLGLDAMHGFKLEELWLESLGLNASGSYAQTGSLQSIPTKDITRETFKRILNNLPYLLKTKGTRRGIRALLNCYGVPSTIYRVKEYSGPYQYRSNTFDIDSQYSKLEKFTLAVHFSGSAKSVSLPLSGTTREFRFCPATGSTIDMGGSITLTPTTGEEGTLSVGGVNLTGPWYNGRWTTVATNGSNTYAFQCVGGKLIEVSAAGGATINGSFGGAATSNVYIQEVRSFSSALPVEVLREHARNPQSIIGSSTVDTYATLGWQNSDDYDYTTAYSELVRRYPLGSTLQRHTTSFPSIHPDQSSTAAGSGNLTETDYVGVEEDYFIWYPNLSDNLDMAEKIRIESSSLYDQLSPKHSVERNQFDTFSTDSPKVGVFFSPQDEINEDIASQFSGLSMDNLIGDPRDDYKPTYSKLEEVSKHYHLKYTDQNKFSDYIRLIENFDASMFYLVKKFLPARSVKMVGLVIQPTLLERSKIPLKPVLMERNDYEMQLSQLPDELVGTPMNLEAEPLIVNKPMEGSYDSLENQLSLQVNTSTLSEIQELFSGIAISTQGALSSNVEYINDNTIERFIPTGRYNHMYGGCRMSGRGFNIPSPETPDGGPVVEFWTNDPNGFGTPTGQMTRNNQNVPANLVGRLGNPPGSIGTSGPGPSPVVNPLGGRVVTNIDGTALGGRAVTNYTGAGTVVPRFPGMALEGRVVTNFVGDGTNTLLPPWLINI